MSYCRVSCDDWRSDVYVIRSFGGQFHVMVAHTKVVYSEPLPPPIDDPDDWDAEDARDEKVMEIRQRSKHVPLGLPLAGEMVVTPNHTACIELLERMRSEGYHIPQHALDRLRDEMNQILNDSQNPDTDRHFTDLLFCGAGDQTLRQIALLHSRVDRALEYLGGQQQPPHWDQEPSQEMLEAEEALNREATLICEQVARDVAMALTGREIEFGKIQE